MFTFAAAKIADLKALRSKYFTLQAWYPVVCNVRETLDAFQQIKFQKVFKTKETFELNDRGVVPLKEGKELECDKETIYTKLYVKKVRKICLFICAKINKIRLPSEDGPGFIVLQTQLAFSLSSLEKKKRDQNQYLGNYPPTPPLTQHSP